MFGMVIRHLSIIRNRSYWLIPAWKYTTPSGAFLIGKYCHEGGRRVATESSAYPKRQALCPSQESRNSGNRHQGDKASRLSSRTKFQLPVSGSTFDVNSASAGERLCLRMRTPISQTLEYAQCPVGPGAEVAPAELTARKLPFKFCRS